MKESIKILTKGNNDIINITEKIQGILKKSKAKSGIINIFVAGSTAGITTIEYEHGLVKDFQEAFEKIAPTNQYYHHHEKWHDNNGSSHVKASILKPDLTIPFENNCLLLGTWQQIALIDFDTSHRERKIIVTVIKDQ